MAVAFKELEEIKTVEDFAEVTQGIRNQDEYKDPAAYAFGWATSQGGKLLKAWFPTVNLDEHHGVAAVAADVCGHFSGTQAFSLCEDDLERIRKSLRPYDDDPGEHPNRNVIDKLIEHYHDPGDNLRVVKPVVVFIGDLSDPPVDAEDVYLRLHLLSHRKVKPHDVNLDEAFVLLNNVVWTDEGPFLTEEFDAVRLKLGRQIEVRSVDKFPRMTDFVVPSGVRIASTAQVRLGAYLGEGTTVMQAGFVNFNAGSHEKAMIEGRISAGVTIGNGTDVGGGVSILGTLSGGNKTVISAGEHCLLEANSGLGIPIGDRVRVEAGLYVKGTTPISVSRWSWKGNDLVTAVIDGTTPESRTLDHVVVKAEELAGISDAIFRRNAKTGTVEVIPRGDSIWGELNEVLHDN